MHDCVTPPLIAVHHPNAKYFLDCKIAHCNINMITGKKKNWQTPACELPRLFGNVSLHTGDKHTTSVQF